MPRVPPSGPIRTIPHCFIAATTTTAPTMSRSPKAVVDSSSPSGTTSLEGDDRGSHRGEFESPKTSPLRRLAPSLRTNRSIRSREGGVMHEKSASKQQNSVERSSLDCPSYLFAPPSSLGAARPQERTRTRTRIHEQKSTFLGSFRDTLPIPVNTSEITLEGEPATSSPISETKPTPLRASILHRSRRDDGHAEGATAVAMASVPTSPRRARRRSSLTGRSSAEEASPPKSPTEAGSGKEATRTTRSPTVGRRTSVRLRNSKGQRTSTPASPGGGKLPSPSTPVKTPGPKVRASTPTTLALPLAALKW